MAKDYYQILGVSKDATDAQLKSAFRQLSKKWHPDMQQGKSDTEKKEAEDKFKELNEAYTVLSDKDKRAQYDQFGSADGQQFNGSPFSDDMFEGMGGMFRHFGFGFNGSPRSQKRPKPEVNVPDNGDDILANINISFKQSVFGMERELDLDLDEPCPDCHGTGVEGGADAKMEECQHCHGAGTITRTIRNGFMIQMNTVPCPHCHGSGYSFTLCKKCNGAKRIPKKKHAKIKIPAGIHDGAKLRLKGHGRCGTCGGADGDMYIEVHVKPSNVFMQLDNGDILTSVTVDPALAALGGDIEFPTLTKMKKLKIPAGTRSGTRFKAKNEGIKDVNGRKHDILVDVFVETPTNLSKEQKELLEKLQKTLKDSNMPETSQWKAAAESFYKE